MATQLSRPIPRTLDAALDPVWLSEILQPISGGGRVIGAEVTDALQINQIIKATVVRFTAQFENGSSADLVLKGYLDREEKPMSSAIRESRFYTDLAPKISVRRPECVAAPRDDEAQFGILYMRDLVKEGAHFCSALEPFDANRTSRSLEELARMHTSDQVLGPIENIDWTSRQIDFLSQIMPVEVLQGLLEDERRHGIPEKMRDGERILNGVRALAVIDGKRPPKLIHGDCHAGNIFETSEGMGLIDFEVIQQGGWALDVAYHIGATLPVEVAEREERALLRHYLESVKGLGGEVPDDEEAWLQYRMSAIYGYFMWGITRTVKRPIINEFCHRLSHSVERHDSFGLLGV